ncbi:uncharacterized protein DEA37_0003386 [Paragonimus westermani]|uniref:Uncharacterized protein n=1 Tax=Paragonimus westermani TaxID=34504 RepID=A0A5J4NCT5_9TREM|nr:uncharacterized protein DEA37_0003386 [Paragonimus westermani]
MQQTLLFITAAGQGQIKTIQWLCENGADPSIRNQLGERPADVARRYGQLAALDLLKSHHLSEKDEESWLERSALSDIPISYAEGEPEPGLLYDKEAAIGKFVENYFSKVQRMDVIVQ